MTASLIRRIDDLLAGAFAAAGLPTDTARASRASRPELADLQCNGVMPLAKSTGRNPREIAGEIAVLLADRPEFDEVGVAGPGFLNLRLSANFLAECAEAQAADPVHVGIEPVESGLVMLDFGGPNVAKPLHVGHLRTLVIGESLRRILGAQGIRTLSDTHLGDWGLQMGMLLSEIRRRWPDLPPGTVPPLTEDDLQVLYPEAAAACRADPARMDEARAATASLQAGDTDSLRVWSELRRISLEAQTRDFALLDAHFDLLLGESDVQPLIPDMIADLRARGLAVESEGALIVEVASPEEAKPMPPLLLAKSDGAALYATTDLATLLSRKREYDPARIIYVVDQRQALHFEQVFRAARRAGYVDGIELIHAGYGTVNGPNGKPYKTREGNVAQLCDLLGDAIGRAAGRLPETSEGLDREQLARLVGLAAVKFADLSSFRTSGYIFDAERMVSFEGRTGPYVQYACVRIGSILAFAEARGAAAGEIVVAAPTERGLVLECARLPDVVASASRNLAPNEIADYVFALAQAFSRFYSECPVLGAADDAERGSRIALCALTRAVLEKGLWLLGITVPARM